MILSEKPAVRRDHLIEIGRICAADRDERKTYHAMLRSWYARGTESEVRARFNKIKAHVQDSTAYLIQPEAMRFGVKVPKKYGEQFDGKLGAVKDELHDIWHGTRAGLTTEALVKWAHVYPTTIAKVVPSAGEATVTVVPDPGDVGVYEPDKPFSRQEAIVHFFPMTLPAFDRLVRGHPREADLRDIARMEASYGAGTDEPTRAATPRVQLGSAFGSDGLAGGATGVLRRGGGAQPEAEVEAPRVLMAELWVVDDRLHDWRVATCLAPHGYLTAVVWDRRTPVLSQMDPFVALTLDDAMDYTWGFSRTDDLSGLQEWREAKMDQIDQLFTLQLKPPIVMGGFGGLSDERARRLRTPDGVLTTSIPNPTVNRLAPTMPPEAFGFLDGIDRQFAETGGFPTLMNPGGAGDQGSGMRAGDQAGTLAKLASARIRSQQMRVKYAASEIATLLIRLHRELHDEPLYTAANERFYLTQIPREIEAMVSSVSTLDEQAEIDKSILLRKMGAIGLPSLVEGVNPQMVDVLKEEARRLEKAAGERQQALMKLAEIKALHGRGGSR